MFGWLKKRREARRLSKLEWKRAIYRRAQDRLLQVIKIMEAENDSFGARKIQSAVLTTIVTCNRNVKRIKHEGNVAGSSNRYLLLFDGMRRER